MDRMTAREADLLKRMGRRIFERRRALNHMCQADLADRAGIPQYMLHRFEEGLCAPNALELLRLADALQTDVQDLLGYSAEAVVMPRLVGT